MKHVTEVYAHLQALHTHLCNTLSDLDGHAFHHDTWQSKLGTGCSSVLEKGRIFEKAGVNISRVSSHHLPPAATERRPDLAGLPFQAMGISLVLHPDNPYIPTTHANIRFFSTDSGVWWFGGGFDLTPYYGFHEDAVHWHNEAKAACDPFGLNLYPRLKAACDQYFYLPHRQEARGIGGLFYDDFNELSFEQSFAFHHSVGEHFLKAYLPIVQKRQDHAFGEREKAFQRYRRGRYVEFNLLYDRGTLFGLQSKGRTESILMSLPPEVTWAYQWAPEPDSPEAKLYTDFLPAREWV